MLAADEARSWTVHPVYVAEGLAWERAEQEMLRQLLGRPPLAGRTAPLARLEFSMSDVYAPTHWAVTGTPPAYDTPDEDVYLHGRNVSLISKAAVYAATRNIGRIALAPLAGNPFPDATAEFLSAFGAALSMGLDAPIDIEAPFSARRRAGCPAGADALLHEPGGDEALRVVQQVPRTPRRLRSRRHPGPHHLRPPQPPLTLPFTTEDTGERQRKESLFKKISPLFLRVLCGEGF